MLIPGHRAGRLLAASVIAMAGAAEAGETVTYSYDALGRLTATSSSGTVNNGVATGIGYDPAGNRSSYAVSGAAGPPPAAGSSFAASDAATTEGSALVFTISRTGGTAAAASVGYATANGSAGAGDYQPASGTLSFAAAETSKTVTVATLDDSIDESDETLTLNLAGASAGASIADAQGLGAIADNDDPPPPPPANNPPTAVNNSGTQAKCTTVLYNVVANDSDVDGDYPLALVSASGPGFSVFSATQVQVASGASAGMTIGSYVVRDSRGATASATLAVNVSGGICQNLAPTPPKTGGGGGS